MLFTDILPPFRDSNAKGKPVPPEDRLPIRTLEHLIKV